MKSCEKSTRRYAKPNSVTDSRFGNTALFESLSYRRIYSVINLTSSTLVVTAIWRAS